MPRLIRTYRREQSLLGIFFWRKGDPYTRLKRTLVLLAVYAISFLAGSIMSILETGAVYKIVVEGGHKAKTCLDDSVRTWFTALVITKALELIFLVPIAQFCFSKNLAGKCWQPCGPLVDGLFYLAIIATITVCGVISSRTMFDVDFGDYKCPGIDGVLCHMNDNTKTGYCTWPQNGKDYLDADESDTLVEADCEPPERLPSLKDFRGAAGLICLIHEDGDSFTLCNIYMSDKRCKTDICIKAAGRKDTFFKYTDVTKDIQAS